MTIFILMKILLILMIVAALTFIVVQLLTYRVKSEALNEIVQGLNKPTQKEIDHLKRANDYFEEMKGL